MEFRCSALLFDLDGVLVDSRAVIERHWKRWALERELDISKVLEAAHGRRTVESIRLVAPALDAMREATELAATEAPDTEGLVEIEGARKLLASLPAEKWAVVTSGIRVAAETRLRHVALPMPAVLVTADDVLQGKPDPEGFLSAAQRLHVPPTDCLVIEDAPAGVAAAKTAGMMAIGVAFQNPLQVLAEADVVVDRLSDIRVLSAGGKSSNIVILAGA